MDSEHEPETMEEQYAEVNEIIQEILKQDFINPEEIELMATKFKNTFLTIENKELFFPFLQKLLKDVNGNDLYNEDRVKSLETEIESFLDRMSTNFSLYHVAGYRDPNDPDTSDKMSEGVEDWEFPNGEYKPPIFGPVIPEDKKDQV